jgi:hypothetical protein
MNPAERRPLRAVRLMLTNRHARLALGVFRRERKRSMRDHEKSKASGFVPAPGKFDANLMRASALEDFIQQLEEQLKNDRRDR